MININTPNSEVLGDLLKGLSELCYEVIDISNGFQRAIRATTDETWPELAKEIAMKYNEALSVLGEYEEFIQNSAYSQSTGQQELLHYIDELASEIFGVSGTLEDVQHEPNQTYFDLMNYVKINATAVLQTIDEELSQLGMGG